MNNLMVVDGLNLAFRWRNKHTFLAEYLNTIESLGYSYEASKIIILSDYGSSFRKNIYPEYKADRPKEKDEEFLNFLNEFNRVLDIAKQRYKVIRFRGVEADDLAAYISKKHKNDFDHTWLISSDKDWNQLLNNKVSRFSFITREEYTPEFCKEKYGLSVELLVTAKAIIGGKDNIKGVNGIGIKRLISITREYGDLFDIYESLPIKSTKKYIIALNEFKEQLLVNHQLVDLLTFCENAIGNDNIITIDKILGNYIYD